ncbi:MAG: signal peptide peptidase SppA [Polyangiaceae bacterium]|nr:signal peptide peptidase SppA [Polyangiaceae bacterium]
MKKGGRHSGAVRWGVAAIAAVSLCTLTTRDAHADPPYKPSETVITPGRTVASADDATATAVNAALLPYMADAELRWSWLWTQGDAKTPGRGHAFDVATPLWFLGTGLRLDALDPPSSAGFPYGEPFYWVRWGLGASLGSTFSVGATFSWSFARERELSGIATISPGLVLRPSPYVSLGFVARDVNQTSDSMVERSYDAALAVRPCLGHRRFEVNLFGSYYERSDKWVPGVSAAIDVPKIGRVRGDLKLFDLGQDTTEVATTIGLEVNLDRFEVSGGGVFGSGITGPGAGFYAGAALHGYRAPGVVLPARVVKVKINETPGTRGHVRLLRKLWRLAKDPEVEGVALVMKAEPASSMAHAEELGDAIRLLRSKGKKSFCHLEDAGGRSLYVCAQTDFIAMNPAGGLRFSGFSARYFLLGGMLEKLGVKSDFVRIGAHKAAAEQLTLAKSTDVAREDRQDLVNQFEKVFLNDVGGGRNVSARELKARLDKGPFIAREAKAAGLVDVLAYEDEIDRVTEEVMGKKARLVDDAPPALAPSYWGGGPKIALVYLAGDMVDGESQSVPFVGINLAGSRTIARALKRAREDASVKAVVFRMETGGGSSLAADVILREAQLTAKVKPLVVSMGSVAASGGYYASMAGTPVMASRSTVTGSIGIFYGKVDVQGLAKMLGANVESVRTSPRADAESMYRPFTDDERVELGKKVKQFYDTFIGRVTEGRKMKAEDVDKVARGRVWTGAQALDHKLIDKLGGLREAINEAKKLAHTPDDVQIVELPEEDDSLLGALFKLVGISSVKMGLNATQLPPLFMDVARALGPFLVFDPNAPLALSEVGEEGSFGGLLSRPVEDEGAALPPRGRAVQAP